MSEAEIYLIKESPDKIRFPEKIGYGLGDFSSNLLWGVSSSFLMYFYTDVYGISPGRVALLLLVARFFDALIDPIIGYRIDRSGGSIVLPLIKWLAVPFGLSAFFAFIPLAGGEYVKLIWAYMTYLVLGAIYSGINTPYGILGNLMTTDPQARVQLGTFRLLGALLGLLLISMLTLPLVHFFGGGTTVLHEAVGFPRYMAAVGVVGAIAWLITYRTAKIRHKQENSNYSIRTLANALKNNRPWILCNAAFGLLMITWCAQTSFPIYYAKVVLAKDADYGGYLLTLNTVMAFLGTLSAPLVSRFLGRKSGVLGCIALAAIATASIGLMPRAQSSFLVSYSIASFGIGTCGPLFYAMLSDTIDYGTAVTGVRAAGLAYSLNSLSQKIAFAVAGSVLATMLDLGGYDPAAAQPSAGAVGWIITGFSWLPFAICVIVFVILLFYPSDDEVDAKVRQVQP